MPVMADDQPCSPTGLNLSTTPTRKSIAELNQPQTEKPLHYTYLKEFRVEQCPLFLQHKCTQHRPFTCFNWHFMNQRRRRPIKKKDGVFNYSPDVYCTQYNETSGECPSGYDCPFLHRVAGDVERRYHLRYYKTSPCVHETDSRGYCVKNGPHCAFAHGQADLRQPVYDVRELQAMEQEEKEGADSKQVVPEDPRWNDTNFVLANYKTEPCKKPPRLCRQGYACPQYHNNRDRRRSPRKYKYRSTPCPNVKHGDEWGDPTTCENGDSCSYCHTRTEQQFHPEIYKSTKCNDMQQTGHCPRGPFCAFAHVEQECNLSTSCGSGSISIIQDKEVGFSSMWDPLRKPDEDDGVSDLFSKNLSLMHQSCSVDSPLSSPSSNSAAMTRSHRSMSMSGTYSSVAEHGLTHPISPLSSSLPTYEKAPGSGRRSSSRDGDSQLFSQFSYGSEPRTPSKILSSSQSPFYTSTAIESVLENAMNDVIDDYDTSEMDRDLNDAASLGSSLSGTNTLGQLTSMGSDPVSIPGSIPRHASFTSQNSMSPTSPMISSHGYFQNQSLGYGPSQSMKSGSLPGSSLFEISAQSPKMQSPHLTSPSGLSSNNDVHRLAEEVLTLRSRLASWEESWTQAKHACEAWKREVTEKTDHLQKSERERLQANMKLMEVESELNNLRLELGDQGGGPHLHTIKSLDELEEVSLIELKQIQLQLRMDSDRLEKIIVKKESVKCTICEHNQRCVVTYPCTHCVMCEECSTSNTECPFCHTQITHKNVIFIPV